MAGTSLRRLCALTLNLPSDSETAEACETWHKPRRFDLEAVGVEMQATTVLQLRANSGDKTVKRMKPLHVRRPWERPVARRRPTTDPAELRKFFGGGGAS